MAKKTPTKGKIIIVTGEGLKIEFEKDNPTILRYLKEIAGAKSVDFPIDEERGRADKIYEEEGLPPITREGGISDDEKKRIVKEMPSSRDIQQFIKSNHFQFGILEIHRYFLEREFHPRRGGTKEMENENDIYTRFYKRIHRAKKNIEKELKGIWECKVDPKNPKRKIYRLVKTS